MPKKKMDEPKNIVCPLCKKELQLRTSKYDFQSILIRKYDCYSCKLRYERHTIFSSLGLVNSDVLYSEEYKDSWKG